MNTNEAAFSVITAESADMASQVDKDKGFFITERSIDRGMIMIQNFTFR